MPVPTTRTSTSGVERVMRRRVERHGGRQAVVDAVKEEGDLRIGRADRKASGDMMDVEVGGGSLGWDEAGTQGKDNVHWTILDVCRGAICNGP